MMNIFPPMTSLQSAQVTQQNDNDDKSDGGESFPSAIVSCLVKTNFCVSLYDEQNCERKT